MTRFKKFAIVMTLLLLTAGLQRLTSHASVSYVPALLLLALLITWLVPQPHYYLILLICFGEATSTLPLGVAIVALLLPIMIQKIQPHLEADVSFTFAGTVFFTTLLQILIFMTYDLVKYSPATPWLLLTKITMLTSSSGFMVIVICTILWPRYFWPAQQSGHYARPFLHHH